MKFQLFPPCLLAFHFLLLEDIKMKWINFQTTICHSHKVKRRAGAVVWDASEWNPNSDEEEVFTTLRILLNRFLFFRIFQPALPIYIYSHIFIRHFKINISRYEASSKNRRRRLGKKSFRFSGLCDRNVKCLVAKKVTHNTKTQADLPKWQFGAYKSMFNVATFNEPSVEKKQ